MILDFLEPIDLSEIKNPNKEWEATQLGANVFFNTENKEITDEYNLAIISVAEDRSSTENHGCGKGVNHIRKELYELYTHFNLPKIIDLGAVKIGHSIKDTQVALQQVIASLLDKKITCIIIGGGHDLSYAQYKAYENKIHDIDLVVIDEKIDLKESNEVNASSFLRQIIMHEPNYLFNVSHLGHQLFYNNPKYIDVLDSLGFDAIRLGELKKDIFEMEPIIRNADLISFDLSALKSADAPANALTSPNGLNGEEACQLCRFAGFSNKSSSFGLYEYNPYFDQNKQAAKQASQMIWYFIEGFAHRKESDYPSEENLDFTKYIVKLESSDYEVVFWKSRYSNKWWMEIPQKDTTNHKFISCSYKDYENAMQDELPDKWMKIYSRLN